MPKVVRKRVGCQRNLPRNLVFPRLSCTSASFGDFRRALPCGIPGKSRRKDQTKLPAFNFSKTRLSMTDVAWHTPRIDPLNLPFRLVQRIIGAFTESSKYTAIDLHLCPDCAIRANITRSTIHVPNGIPLCVNLFQSLGSTGRWCPYP